MAKANKKKVDPKAFLDTFASRLGLTDLRDAEEALDVVLRVQQLYGGMLETIGMLSIMLTKEGLVSFTISPHLMANPERIDWAIHSLEKVKGILEEAKKNKTTAE